MHNRIELIGNAVQLHLPGDPGLGVSVIFGGADGILVTINAAGEIHVQGSEGPGPDEIRSAVAAIHESFAVLSRAAQVELNPQPIPPGREGR